MALPSTDVYFGIDLGTTFSTVSWIDPCGICRSLSVLGSTSVPSVIHAPEKSNQEYTFGKASENYNTNILYEIKRLMGMDFRDERVQELIRTNHFASFEVVEGPNGKAMAEFIEKDKKVRKYPYEVSAMLLKYLHDEVCRSFNFPPDRVLPCVISVPAYFTHFQRADTILAGRQARFDVMKIVNEPTAAAIAAAVSNKMTAGRKERLMVFDFGGGTLDVTVMDVTLDGLKKNFRVVSTHGDTFLGGVDIDQAVVDLILDKMKRDHPEEFEEFFVMGTPAKASKSKIITRNRLRKAACKAKIEKLSHGEKATIDMEDLCDDCDFYVDITPEEFNQKISGLMDRCIKVIEESFNKVEKFGKESIDHVLMVGGSSQVMEVRRRVEEFFGRNIILYNNIPVLEAVSIGAATLANEIGNNEGLFSVQEVCPVSLGVRFLRGTSGTEYIEHLIPASTPIPCKATTRSVTMEDDQESGLNSVYQGDEDEPHPKNLIVEYTISNLPRRKAGEVKFEHMMEYDENGLVTVSSKVVEPEGVRMKGEAGAVFSMTGADVSRYGVKSTSVECEDFD